jgi:hypothetical protein
VDYPRAGLYPGMLDGTYADLDDEAILVRLLAGVATTPGTAAAPPEPVVHATGEDPRVRLSTLLGRGRSRPSTHPAARQPSTAARKIAS